MPVSDTHAEYGAAKEIWDKCTIGMGGQSAVKAAGRQFLPPTSGMLSRWDKGGKKAYDAYKLRARYSGVATEALEGALGVLFSTTPAGPVDLPVTREGWTVRQLARNVAAAVYSKGRRVLVVEQEPGSGTPYIAQYAAESMINWRDLNGILKLCVFTELRETGGGDIFTPETEIQYREYNGFQNVVRVWDKDLNPISETKMSADGALPVVVIGASGCSCKIDQPPALRIIECALAAYLNSADRQQSLYQTANPTMYSAGCSKEQYEANNAAGTGGGAHWYLGEGQWSKSGYIEFSGNGVSAIEKSESAELEAAAEYAVKLAHVNGVEAAAAKAARDTAQKSTLQMMGESISEGIRQALEMYSARSVRPVNLGDDPFAIKVQSVAVAEATMIQSLGSQIMAGTMPARIGYNYAVTTQLYKGTYDQWIDEIKTNALSLLASES